MTEKRTDEAQGQAERNDGRVPARPEDPDRGSSVEEGGQGGLDRPASAMPERGALALGVALLVAGGWCLAALA